MAKDESAWSEDQMKMVMESLAKYRAEAGPLKFHEFLLKNESALFPFLNKHGYRGSKLNPDDTVREFDRAYRHWQDARAAQSGYDLPPPPAKHDPWQDVWRTGAENPIAAVWIVLTLAVNELLAKRLGFEVDPKKLSASAQLVAHSAELLAFARPEKGSATPGVPVRGGAASGKPGMTYTPGPYHMEAGEIKSLNSGVAGRRQLAKYIGQLPDTSIVGVITYDMHGNIYLEQRTAGLSQDIVWEGKLGTIPPELMPKARYGSSEFGNAMEPLIRDMFDKRTGQVSERKSSSGSGADIRKEHEEVNSSPKVNLLESRLQEPKPPTKKGPRVNLLQPKVGTPKPPSLGAQESLREIVDGLKQTDPSKAVQRDNIIVNILKGKNQYFEIKEGINHMEIKLRENMDLKPEQRHELMKALSEALFVYKKQKDDGIKISHNQDNHFLQIPVHDFHKLIAAKPAPKPEPVMVPTVPTDETQSLVAQLKQTSDENSIQRENLLLEILSDLNKYFEIKSADGHYEIKIKDSVNLNAVQKQELIGALNNALLLYREQNNIMANVLRDPQSNCIKIPSDDYVKLINKAETHYENRMNNR